MSNANRIGPYLRHFGSRPDPWRQPSDFLETPVRCRGCLNIRDHADLELDLAEHRASCPDCQVPSRLPEGGRNPDYRPCWIRYEIQRKVEDYAHRMLRDGKPGGTYGGHHCVPHKCAFGPNCQMCLSLFEPDLTYGEIYARDGKC